jgi:segregation and condensation protein B
VDPPADQPPAGETPRADAAPACPVPPAPPPNPDGEPETPSPPPAAPEEQPAVSAVPDAQPNPPAENEQSAGDAGTTSTTAEEKPTGTKAAVAEAEETAPGAEPEAVLEETTAESAETAPPAGQAAPPVDLSRSQLAAKIVDSGLAESVEEDEEEAAVEPELVARYKPALEALLFAAEEIVTARELARAVGLKPPEVRTVLKFLKEIYNRERRGWELCGVAGGYRLMTRPEHFEAVQKLRAQTQQRRLTQAALETLALVAYAQKPITRAEVEAVRGVDAAPVLRQLLERKLIRIAGRARGLGAPLLYSVSQEFLEHFGLRSARDLPRPGEFKTLVEPKAERNPPPAQSGPPAPLQCDPPPQEGGPPPPRDGNP